MKLSAKIVKAAMVCQAKNDVRTYLQGFNITAKHIEATNGHVCVRMEHGIKRAKKGIYNIKGRIPAKCIDIEFIVKKDLKLVRFLGFCDEEIGLAPLEVIDGKFPNLGKVIKQRTAKNDSNIVALMNVDYMAYPAKMFKERFVSIKQEFNGEYSAIKMTLDGKFMNEIYGNPVFIVMPTRSADHGK